MPHPLVSVLLPARNAADHLPECLECLSGQTVPDIEIIAVDDGSDDGGRTLRTLLDHRRADPRLKVLSPGRLGIATALNLAVSHARGRFLARMDSDDLCHPERLALQACLLDERPELDAVGCLVRFGGDSERAAGYARHVDWINGLRSHEDMALGVFRDAPLAHPSVMFRAASFLRLGGYRHGDFPEDYELWLRWLEQGARLAKAERELLVWRDPPDRLSRSDPRYSQEAFHRLKAPYLARWLAARNPLHPEVWVVGAGRPTRKRAEFLCRAGVRIACYLDIDPRKIGQVLQGRPVLHHDELPEPGRAFVVSYVSTPGAVEQVAAFLEGRGYRAGRDYVQAG